MEQFRQIVLVLVLSCISPAIFSQILPPPQNLSGSWICDSTRIEWEPPAGGHVLGYNVYMRITDEDPWVLLRENIHHTVTELLMLEIIDYCIGITAVFEQGESLPAINCEYDLIEVPIVAPTPLNLKRTGRNLELTWSAGKFGCGAAVGYNVYRTYNSSPWVVVAQYGAGDTVHVDEDLSDGTWCYFIEIESSTEQLSSEEICRVIQLTGIDDNSSLTRNYSLDQNYPNPFNPTTRIPFRLAEAGTVKITLFNTLGEQVMLLVDGFYGAGSHAVTLQAANLSAGSYFYRIQSDAFQATRRMTIAR